MSVPQIEIVVLELVEALRLARPAVLMSTQENIGTPDQIEQVRILSRVDAVLARVILFYDPIAPPMPVKTKRKGKR